MNPRIAKEIRVLLPAFGLMLAAATLPMLLDRGRHELLDVCMTFLFLLGCLIMGAELFGNEFHQKTMPALLTQPISRSTIWREKILSLAAALVLGTGLFLGAVRLFHQHTFRDPEFPWMAFVVIPVAVLGSAPYWTLVFRSTFAGGFVSVLVPLLMLGVNSYCHDLWLGNGNALYNKWLVLNGAIHHLWVRDPVAEENSVLTLLLLYAAVCLWLGYRKFQRLQIVDGYSMTASRELGLPPRIEAMLLRPFRTLASGIQGHMASLLKKELRVQQMTFVGAGVFCVVAIGLGALLITIPAATKAHETISLSLALGFYFYILVLPLVTGAIAVAEEKAWGVADWQMTLPPSVLKQWWVKILTTLGTGIVLGLILPAALALAGTLIYGVEQDAAMPRLHSLGAVLTRVFSGGAHDGASPVTLPRAALVVCCVVLAQMLLTSVAIHAGTIAKSTARALVLALGTLILGFWVVRTGIGIARLLWGMGVDGQAAFAVAKPDPVDLVGILAVEMLLLLFLVHRFAYRCHRARGMNWKIFAWQAPVFGCAVGVLAITSTLAFLASRYGW